MDRGYGMCVYVCSIVCVWVGVGVEAGRGTRDERGTRHGIVYK